MSSAATIPYHQLPALEHVYLEDSWVLDIQITHRTVRFVLDLVLTNDHRLYAPPPPHEAYCYRKAELTFSDVSDVRWSNAGLLPAVDATGTIDFGNIDFLHKQAGQFVLGGDWGHMRIESTNPTLAFVLSDEQRDRPDEPSKPEDGG